mmetsp:Transcript_13386/g.27312  ORF Transcript_13386/g.27312 Transcript_13386/m.27312 type:complete len:171 (+) Transcript_13386:589-1101(+)
MAAAVPPETNLLMLEEPAGLANQMFPDESVAKLVALEVSGTVCVLTSAALEAYFSNALLVRRTYAPDAYEIVRSEEIAPSTSTTLAAGVDELAPILFRVAVYSQVAVPPPVHLSVVHQRAHKLPLASKLKEKSLRVVLELVEYPKLVAYDLIVVLNLRVIDADGVSESNL